jgi:antitoxin (DNA-binding transcriptional repressor) of toxin-antitoxin stability system
MTRVNIDPSDPELSALLDRVQTGEEIVLCRNGDPVARLVPIEALGLRQPGLLKGRVDDAFFEALPQGELEAGEPTAPVATRGTPA